MYVDVNLIGNRPSIIAVAATLVAMDPKLTKSSLDLKIKAFSPIGFLEIVSPYSRLYIFCSKNTRFKV